MRELTLEDGIQDRDDDDDFDQGGAPGSAGYRERRRELFRRGLNPDAPIEEQRSHVDVAREEVIPKLMAMLLDINDEEKPLPQRLELCSKVATLLMPVLVMEGLQPMPNPDRSTTLSRALSSLRDTVTILKSKRDVEMEDTLNPYSPKFAAVFGWFFQLFYETLAKQQVDEIVINNVFESFSLDLIGWEEKIEKRLKGVAGKNLETLSSPFIKEFTDNIPKSESEPVIDPSITDPSLNPLARDDDDTGQA